MTYPDSYKYTKEHEWVHVEGVQGTVGITDHAQHELGDIVFVDLPKVGDKIGKGETFASVESVKAVSEIYSPVTGEIAAVNDLSGKKSAKLNEDPHGDGWLVKVKISSPDELNALMSSADYQKYVGAE